MLAFVLLGPVVQPWYLTWGIILMAPGGHRPLLYVVLGLSIVAPFIGLTGGADLLHQLVHTNPVSMVAGRLRAVGRRHAPAGRLDDVVADRPARLPALPAPTDSPVLES